MGSMAPTDISPDRENILLRQLFLPHDISNSYNTFFSDNKPSPKHVATTPLPFTPEPLLQRIDPRFCDKLIYLGQHLHTVGFSLF